MRKLCVCFAFRSAYVKFQNNASAYASRSAYAKNILLLMLFIPDLLMLQLCLFLCKKHIFFAHPASRPCPSPPPPPPPSSGPPPAPPPPPPRPHAPRAVRLRLWLWGCRLRPNARCWLVLPYVPWLKKKGLRLRRFRFLHGGFQRRPHPKAFIDTSIRRGVDRGVSTCVLLLTCFLLMLFCDYAFCSCF